MNKTVIDMINGYTFEGIQGETLDENGVVWVTLTDCRQVVYIDATQGNKVTESVPLPGTRRFAAHQIVHMGPSHLK